MSRKRPRQTMAPAGTATAAATFLLLLSAVASFAPPHNVVTFQSITSRTATQRITTATRHLQPLLRAVPPLANGDHEHSSNDASNATATKADSATATANHIASVAQQLLDLDSDNKLEELSASIPILLNKTATQAADAISNVTSNSNNYTITAQNISDALADPSSLLASSLSSLSPSPPPPPVCRIVTRAGSRLPSDAQVLPSLEILNKLQAYYHAQARQQNILVAGAQTDEDLEYYHVHHPTITKTTTPKSSSAAVTSTTTTPKVASTLRHSLEDAGYTLLSRRDIDLCESLNAGYLLRLSILPDVSQLDPSIAKEFYPEWVDDDGEIDTTINKNELLFDGRVLVYWRGYCQEVTRGRLLLPKIDYLQASLVQRSAAWVNRRLAHVEGRLLRRILAQTRKLRRKLAKLQRKTIQKLKIRELANKVQGSLTSSNNDNNSVQGNVMDSIFGNDDGQDDDHDENLSASNANRRSGSIKLGRYGGSKIRFVGSPDPSDALEPFTICEYNYDDDDDDTTSGVVYTNGTSSIPPTPSKSRTSRSSKLKNQSSNATVAICEHDMYDEMNHNSFTCEYDARAMADGKINSLPKMQLLERVTISNLVDLFTKEGRREVLRALFSKSKLVEPTYEEVMVVWRPLVKQKKKKRAPPKIVSEFADMFDIEGFEQPESEEIKVPKGKLEIRTFEQVPMSNLPAVLPKTKLVFRPADAFLFDLISVITLSLVLSSVKFDSTRLDVLALASVSFWLFRTIIRYSNKLARYDLLVKTFLTSKISQRNVGAFKYLTYESSSQRAIRAALVHSWILQYFQSGLSGTVTRDDLEQNCVSEVNKRLNTDREVQLDPKRAIQDLEDLRLIRFSDNGELIPEALNLADSTGIIKQLWVELLDRETAMAHIISDGTEDHAVKPPLSAVADKQNSVYNVPSPVKPTIKSKDGY